jgi:hypothetical protein
VVADDLRGVRGLQVLDENVVVLLVLLFALAAVLLLGGLGVYLMKNTDWWARVREGDATRVARAQEERAGVEVVFTLLQNSLLETSNKQQ